MLASTHREGSVIVVVVVVVVVVNVVGLIRFCMSMLNDDNRRSGRINKECSTGSDVAMEEAS